MAVKMQEALERDAAEWAIALDRGLSAKEQKTLDIWLAKDRRREGALVRARAIWLAASGATTKAAAKPSPRGPDRRWVLTGSMAAGLAGAIGLGVHVARRGDFRTRRGEVRRLAMADGSEAVLNAQTRMNVRLSDRQRRVDLESGEAWFDVAKDPSRPFVVTTSSARVIAVGTAFSVREDGELTEIVVSEGRVRVEPSAGKVVYLSAGETLQVAQARPARKVDLGPSDLRRRLAWREGLIMLDGETLAEAAAQFSQYGGRRIVVAPEVAERRVVGVFRIHDAMGFAQANADLMSLKISSDADEIRLSPSNNVTETSQ